MCIINISITLLSHCEHNNLLRNTTRIPIFAELLFLKVNKTFAFPSLFHSQIILNNNNFIVSSEFLQIFQGGKSSLFYFSCKRYTTRFWSDKWCTRLHILRLVLSETRTKMSDLWGNVVHPSEFRKWKTYPFWGESETLDWLSTWCNFVFHSVKRQWPH